MTTPEIPPTTEPCLKTCIETTKAGKPCSNHVVSGSNVCFSHSEHQREAAKRASEASAKARKATVTARKEASEQAKLSLTEVIRSQAAMKRTEIAKALVEAAVADGSSRAMAELLNRVEGKVTDSLNLNAGDPFTMDEASLHRWLSESPTVDDEGSAPTKPLDSGLDDAQGHTDRPNPSSKDPS